MIPDRAPDCAADCAPDRAYVLMRSGRKLDLLDPDPGAWTDEDLALGLARTYRWAGQSRWDRPLSVAQHSLTVLAIREAAAGQKLTPAEALREVLHDADEAFLGFDCIRPVKPHLGAGYAGLVERLQAAVACRYGLPRWTADDYQAHKRADHRAAASEARHVVGWNDAEIRDSLRIEAEPLALDPAPREPGLQPWEPWPAPVAASRFLKALRTLTGLVEQHQARTETPRPVAGKV